MAQEITSKGIFQLIRNAAQAEPWIQLIRTSDYWIEETKDNNFPILIVDVEGGSSQDQPRLVTFSCTLRLLSQRRDDNSNFEDLTSTSRLVLQDIVTRLNSVPYTTDFGVRVLDSPNYSSIKWRGNDKLIGAQVTLNLRVPSAICIDQLPTAVGSPVLPCPEEDCESEVYVNSTSQQLTTTALTCNQDFIYNVPDSKVRNSDFSLNTSLPATESLILSDITMFNTDGDDIDTFPAAVDVTIPDIAWINLSGQSITHISGVYPQFSLGVIQNVDIINQDGQSANVAFSGTMHTDFATTNTITGATIAYRRPFYHGQSISYNVDDVAAQASAGTYNYPPTEDYTQKLDWDAAEPFYTLKHPNEFGNYFRFTDDLGNSGADLKANFGSAVWTGASTYYYVIDHLTGLGWMNNSVGYNDDWADAITSAETWSYSGYTGFRMPSRGEFLSVTSIENAQWYGAENIFVRTSNLPNSSGNGINIWLSDSQSSNPTNAYIYNDSGGISVRNKTSPSFNSNFPVRTHYQDYLEVSAVTIAYQRPQQFVLGTSYLTGDQHWHLQNGTYNYTPPEVNARTASLDYTATESDVRSGTFYGPSGDGTDNIAPTYLNANNAFGNKYRFTDDEGNPANGTNGGEYRHVDWRGHSWTGTVTPNYVIDHLTGLGYYNALLFSGSAFNMDVTSDGLPWSGWVTHVESLGTFNGYDGWRTLSLGEAAGGPHGANAMLDIDWADNFFSASTTGGQRHYTLTCDSTDANNFQALGDTSNQDLTDELGKAQNGGFPYRILNVFIVRNHY